MSLAEIEAYERERRRRRERIRRIVSWAPLGTAVLMLAVGGLSVWSASSGHEADQAEVATLVEDLESEAEEAEADFHTAWIKSVEDSSPTRVERVATDGETMHALLREVVAAEDDVWDPPPTTDDEILDPLHALVSEGVPGLDTGSRARLGTFDPVLVDIEVGSYSYFAYVDVFDTDDVTEEEDEEDDREPAVAALSVSWTTANEGAITRIDAHWTDGIPEHS
ncbi:hypothetical protein [Nocardiopsis alkaliphila]|uniref:hypothetical protein n=1 Tax=Nocardiopsis alkaliphila TaxID=225762 RepID=UPI00034D1E18|nr:hypothetical protein [Nocardiopsis alkaliphila]